MASIVNLDARLNLKGLTPGSVKKVEADLRRQLKGINIPIGVSGPGLKQVATQTSAATQNIKKLTTQTNSAAQSLKNAFSHQNVLGVKNIGTQLRGSERAATSFANSIALATKRFIAFNIGALGLVKGIVAIKQAFQETVEFQSGLVEIGQIFGSRISSAKIQALSKDIRSITTEIGADRQRVLGGITALAQAGEKDLKPFVKLFAELSLNKQVEDVRQLGRASVVFKRVFGKETASEIRDTFNQVLTTAKLTNVGVQDLIESVSILGNVFKQVGGDELELFATVAATVDRSGRGAVEVSRAIQTIVSRISASPETIKALDAFGIDVFDKKTKRFRGLTEIITDVDILLQKLPQTGREANQLIRQLGGVRRFGAVGAVVGSVGRSRELQERLRAQRGQDQITNDVFIAQEGLENQIQRTINAWLELNTTFIESTAINSAIQGILGITKGLIGLGDGLKDILPLLAIGLGAGLGRRLLGSGARRARGFGRSLTSRVNISGISNRGLRLAGGGALLGAGIAGRQIGGKAGGALEGASIGAFVGSALGPIGTAVGATVGALTGFSNALDEAADKALKLAVEGQQKITSDAIRATGRASSAVSIRALTQNLEKFRKQRADIETFDNLGSISGKIARLRSISVNREEREGVRQGQREDLAELRQLNELTLRQLEAARTELLEGDISISNLEQFQSKFGGQTILDFAEQLIGSNAFTKETARLIEKQSGPTGSIQRLKDVKEFKKELSELEKAISQTTSGILSGIAVLTTSKNQALLSQLAIDRRSFQLINLANAQAGISPSVANIQQQKNIIATRLGGTSNVGELGGNLLFGQARLADLEEQRSKVRQNTIEFIELTEKMSSMKSSVEQTKQALKELGNVSKELALTQKQLNEIENQKRLRTATGATFFKLQPKQQIEFLVNRALAQKVARAGDINIFGDQRDLQGRALVGRAIQGLEAGRNERIFGRGGDLTGQQLLDALIPGAKFAGRQLFADPPGEQARKQALQKQQLNLVAEAREGPDAALALGARQNVGLRGAQVAAQKDALAGALAQRGLLRQELGFDAEQLVVMNQFGAQLNTFVKGLEENPIPESIELAGQHQVNVVIQGGEIFQLLEDEIQKMIVTAVNQAFRNTINPDGSINEPIRPPLNNKVGR